MSERVANAGIEALLGLPRLLRTAQPPQVRLQVEENLVRE